MSEEGTKPETQQATSSRKKIVVSGAAAKLTRWLGYAILASYFPIAGVYAHSQKAETRCEKIATDVHTGGQDVMITDKGLHRLIDSEFPELKGQRLNEIDYSDLEKQIEQLDVVRRCEAYPTIDGTVHIEIYQRKPIMRVFSSGGSYYMDEEGYKIAALPGMRTHTLIVNGHVNSMIDVSSLIDLCNYIKRSDLWNSMIEQVYVTKKQEFVLVPRVGNHVVEFGTTVNMEQKFKNLELLYRRGWVKQEWNVYSRVSLKYDGQIICTKR